MNIYPFAVIHSGINGCREVAFYLKKELSEVWVVMAENMLWPDKRKPEGGDPLECGSCKCNLSNYRIVTLEQPIEDEK